MGADEESAASAKRRKERTVSHRVVSVVPALSEAARGRQAENAPAAAASPTGMRSGLAGRIERTSFKCNHSSSSSVHLRKKSPNRAVITQSLTLIPACWFKKYSYTLVLKACGSHPIDIQSQYFFRSVIPAVLQSVQSPVLPT